VTNAIDVVPMSADDLAVIQDASAAILAVQ